MHYSDELMIARCFALARNGIGTVSPNPPVGAVLVHGDEIIGEGFHTRYGKPHAEVEAIDSVPPHKRHLIPESTLYVSLEPCCIHSKTPPCTDLIIREGIKDVRISIMDPNPQIAGKGVEIMRSNGIKVVCGILPEDGKNLIRAFSTNITYHRPHIILKWAQSKFGYMGQHDQRIFLSHPYTATWSHQLRAGVDAIIAGARTIRLDDPLLNTREFPGDSPHRVVYDPTGNLQSHYNVFRKDGKTVFYFSGKENNDIQQENVLKYILHTKDHIQQITSTLFKNKIGILLVEGGAFLLNKFIAADLWDEAWIIRSDHNLPNGIAAPVVRGKLIHQFSSGTDTVIGIKNATIN